MNGSVAGVTVAASMSAEAMFTVVSAVGTNPRLTPTCVVPPSLTDVVIDDTTTRCMSSSMSSGAVTITGCVVSWLPGVKVRVAGAIVATAVLRLVTVSVTSARGRGSSAAAT